MGNDIWREGEREIETISRKWMSVREREGDGFGFGTRRSRKSSMIVVVVVTTTIASRINGIYVDKYKRW